MGVDVHLSERALREIYCRGFEIAIKESKPVAIMSSYNLVNGVHAANSKDLCTRIVRDEWGFEGRDHVGLEYYGTQGRKYSMEVHSCRK